MVSHGSNSSQKASAMFLFFFFLSAMFLKTFYFGCFVQENMHLHAYSGTRIKNVD